MSKPQNRITRACAPPSPTPLTHLSLSVPVYPCSALHTAHLANSWASGYHSTKAGNQAYPSPSWHFKELAILYSTFWWILITVKLPLLPKFYSPPSVNTTPAYRPLVPLWWKETGGAHEVLWHELVYFPSHYPGHTGCSINRFHIY